MTLAFAGIGAATGLLTFGNEVSKRRAERRARDEEAAQDWSMTAKPNPEVNGWTLEVRYEAPQEAPMTLVSMRLIEPREATLSRSKRASSPNERDRIVSVDDVWSSVVELGVEMAPGYHMSPGNIRPTDYATRSVVCRLPESATTGRIRFRTSLTIEDNSAARRRSSFIVRSQEIAWTANNADKAT